MSGSAFGATLALLIAAALLIADTFKNVVLEYGAFQAGRFIHWGFFQFGSTGRVASQTCVTIETYNERTVERVVSMFEREVVWSERHSNVLAFISPLLDYPQYFGFPALLLFFCCCRVSVFAPGSRQRGPGPSMHGGAGSRIPNPRPVLQRGRGTLA